MPGAYSVAVEPQALRLRLIEPEATRRAWMAEGLRAAGLDVEARESPATESGIAPDCVALAIEAFSAAAVAALHDRDPLLPVIVIARAEPGAAATCELGRARAWDVVTVAGRDDLPELASGIRAAASRRERRRVPRRVAGELGGTSDAMQQVRWHVEQAARSTANVLVTGESGTGKEVVARAIHRHSPRSSAPFVAVNCAAIPAELLESELFGHERGAFTGATATTRGIFEQADGGTLFLDEIGELPAALQAKLLRVLAPDRDAATTRELHRVGGGKPVRVDVRVIAATHRPLRDMIAEGGFRADLYQRIAGLDVQVPPLRARGEDVAVLARLFLERASADAGRAGSWLGAAALKVITRYYWPRNVRQLEAVMRSVVLLKEQPGQVTLGDLPAELFEPAPGESAPGQPPPDESSTGGDAPMRTLAEVERSHVEHVLSRCGDNKTQAARILGLSRAALGRKLAAWTRGRPPDPA